MRVISSRRFERSAWAAALLVLAAASALRAQSAAPPPTLIDVRYPSGDLTLAALLMVPPSSRPLPAAVIVQGSGRSDRTNEWARAIADELVRNGVAVLLTDKRGSGESGGDWRTSGFAELADDALAGVAFLAGRPEIDRRRIGLAGLSQGGWIAPLAAARSPAVAFVIDISGTSVTFAEQSFHEMANTARQAGLSDTLVQEVLRVNAAAARYLATGDWEQYSRARAHGLTTGAARIVEGFPASAEVPIWGFLRKVAFFDPLPYWLLVTQPVLVVYGELDESDNVPVAESVRRLQYVFGSIGKENYQITVVPAVGHGLIDHAQHRLAPLFTTSLAGWLDRYVTAAPGGTSRPR